MEFTCFARNRQSNLTTYLEAGEVSQPPGDLLAPPAGSGQVGMYNTCSVSMYVPVHIHKITLFAYRK